MGKFWSSIEGLMSRWCKKWWAKIGQLDCKKMMFERQPFSLMFVKKDLLKDDWNSKTVRERRKKEQS